MFSIVIFIYICVQQERSSLLKKLATLKDLDCACPADKLTAADVDQSMQLSITGLETFCLSNKVLFVVHFKLPHLCFSCDTEMIYLVVRCRSNGHYLF